MAATDVSVSSRWWYATPAPDAANGAGAYRGVAASDSSNGGSSGSDEEEEEEDTPLQLQKAHAARLAQGRARHRAAAQQMADLHRYRVQQQQQAGQQWRDDFAAEMSNTLAPVAASAGGHGGAADALQRQQYEARWAEFEARPPDTVTCANIPWPPSAAQLLQWLADAAQLQPPYPSRAAASCRHSTAPQHEQPLAGRQNDAHAAAQRSAFRQASMRWHPDKFESRHGLRISAEERPAVTAAVQALMQGINAAGAAQTTAARS